MNFLFFNRSFYPDTEATGQFLTELCEDLAEFGHKVTVICGKSYHVGNDENSSLIKRESYKSIEILRTSGTTLPKKNLFFRLINLGTYFLNAFFAGFLVKQKPDVVVALTDPPLLGLHGIFFSIWHRAKFIYYCKDIYPDVGMITGKLRHPVYIFILKIANNLSFKFAKRIICIGEDMKEKIESKGDFREKIEIVHDWANTKELYPIDSNENPFIRKHNLKNKFIIMYSGNIGLTQGLDRIIKIAEKFNKNERVKFLLIGEGADKENLQKLVIKKELNNVIFLPYQPKEELKYSLSAADIHLITFQKGLAGVIVPSKVYGILACGRPFIAWIDEEGEISNIASKYECGIVVPPGNTDKMIEKIKWSLTNEDKLKEMGENGRRAAVEFFDRKVSVLKFNSVLMQVVGI